MTASGRGPRLLRSREEARQPWRRVSELRYTRILAGCRCRGSLGSLAACGLPDPSVSRRDMLVLVRAVSRTRETLVDTF